MRERRYPKFEVLGSTFRRPRTSEFGRSPVPLVPPVSPGYSAWVLLLSQTCRPVKFGVPSEFFRSLLVLYQPGSRRPIHNRKPPKESLCQIGVVPDLDDSTGSDRRHALSCDHRPVQASGSFNPDRTRRIQQAVDVNAGQLHRHPCPWRLCPRRRWAEDRNRFPCCTRLEHHMTLHDQKPFKIVRIQHQRSHIIDTRRLPIDCVDEDQSTMVSDGLRFQRVCRRDSLIRVRGPLRMELPQTIESIIGPPAQRDLLERVVVPPIEPYPRRRILVQVHVFRKRRIRTLTRWRRDDRDGPSNPIFRPAILRIQYLVIRLTGNWGRSALEDKVLDSLHREIAQNPLIAPMDPDGRFTAWLHGAESLSNLYRRADRGNRHRPELKLNRSCNRPVINRRSRYLNRAQQTWLQRTIHFQFKNPTKSSQSIVEAVGRII